MRNVKLPGLGYVILLAAMAGCVSPSPFHTSTRSTSSEQQEPIACWGDSLTQGNQDLTGVSYPGVLQQLLGVTVYNGGVDGQTSTQIAARMLARQTCTAIRTCFGRAETTTSRLRTRSRRYFQTLPRW